MFKKALYDYIGALHWENIKKNSNFSSVWLVIYMLFMLPLQIISRKDDLDTIIRYYGIMIIFLVGMYATAIVKLSLPKQMYLCPLSKEERKKYLNCLCWIKIFLPIVIWLIVQTIGFIAGWSIWQNMINTLCMFSTMVSMTISPANGFGASRTEEEKKMSKIPVFKGLTTISVINMLCAVLLLIVVTALLETGDAGSLWFGFFAGFSILLQIILDVLLIARYKTPVIEYAISYEKTSVTGNERRG